MMRYMLVLSVIFFSTDMVTALPAHTGLLEVRSMPVLHKKPITRLWSKIARKVHNDMWDSSMEINGTHVAMFASFSAVFMSVIGSASPKIDFPIPPEVIIPIYGLTLPPPIIGLVREIRTQQRFRKQLVRGEYIHYVHSQEGTETLCFGCIQEVSDVVERISRVTVETYHHGEVSVPIDDIIGVSLPDHPDLLRRVSLLASAHYTYDLHHIGQVVRVYNNGNYELRVDHKTDLNGVESRLDEPITIFVNASLPEAEGGFVFRDDKAETHEDKDYYTYNPFYDELLALARQTDSAQEELATSIMPEHN